jgi:arabinofuranosyltransferase
VKRLGIVLGLFTVLFVFSAYVCDDAFITFRTVDNLVRGLGLRWNVAERVQVFTSPLFTGLFALPYAVLRDPGDLPNPGRVYWLAIALSFVLSAWTMVRLARAHADTPWLWALLALLFSSQAFVTFLSSGLETPLVYLVIVLFFSRWLQRDPQTVSEFAFLFLLAGLALLTRLDLLLLFAPPIAYLTLAGWRRFGIRILLPGLAGIGPVLAWHAFAVCYFGFLLPNSYYAKLGIDAPRSVLWSMGRHYVAESLRQDPMTLAVSAAAFALCWLRWRTFVAGVGAALYLAYIVSIGGDFLGFRFLTPSFLVCAMILADIAVRVMSRPPRWVVAAPVAGAIVCSLLTPASPLRAIREGPRAPDVEYYFPASGLAHWRPGRPFPFAKFLQIDDLADCQSRRAVEPIAAVGGDGLNGFCRGPHAFLVDPHGITDPLMARISRPVAKQFKPAHIWKPVPAGYLESTRDGSNHIEDPELAAFYGSLRTVIGGRLWTRGRWRAIWTLNLTSAARYRRPYAAADPSVQ